MAIKTLISGKVALILAIVLLLIVAVAAVLIVNKVNEDNRLRELQRLDGLRTAYFANVTAADGIYDSLSDYSGMPNKNNSAEYRVWVDGYKKLIGNFSSGVNKSNLAGKVYQAEFANDTEDYLIVEQNQSRLTGYLTGVNSNYTHYEEEYQQGVQARDQARQNYETACAGASALYSKAHDDLFMEDYTLAYTGLKNYLNGTAENTTAYKNSIAVVETAAAGYQSFLRFDSLEYDDTVNKIEDLKRNGNTLDARYAVLQKKIPRLTVSIKSTDFNVGTDARMYQYFTFQITNEDYPAKVWNIVIHFRLVDKQTGAIRDQYDKPVVMHVGISNFEGVPMHYDEGHSYDLKWTATYDY